MVYSPQDNNKSELQKQAISPDNSGLTIVTVHQGTLKLPNSVAFQSLQQFSKHLRLPIIAINLFMSIDNKMKLTVCTILYCSLFASH